MNIVRFDSLESTNKYCELLDLNQVEEFTVVWAWEQTGGVGQQGSHWESEVGKNLTFSVVLHPEFLPASSQFQLTQMLSLAVADYLRQEMPLQAVAIKWPNDIYMGYKKICGMLTQTRITSGRIASAVCGIGLNVNQMQFSSDIPNPTSMAICSGREYVLESVLHDVLAAIEQRYRQLEQGNAQRLQEDYLSKLLNKGRPARYWYKGREITAIIQGVDAYGHLVLLDEAQHIVKSEVKEIRFLF